MLGPVDMDDWRDDDELRDLLRAHPQILRLRNRRVSALPGWSRTDFRLAQRLSDDEALGEDEIRRLAQLLGA